MAQLPSAAVDFARFLAGLTARLDRRSGWLAVFLERDPDGMAACLAGSELPPWDVVDALLQDLAADQGAAAARTEAATARALHAAATAAHDGGPGAAAALARRLDVLLRERRYTAERLQELTAHRATATTEEAAAALDVDLAWAEDDHRRATARCAELRARADALAAPAPAPAPAAPERPAGQAKPKRRPRGGARFAGIAEEAAEPPGAAPVAPAPAAAVRGARFAGVAEPAGEPAPPRPGPEEARAAGGAVARLHALRAQGRGGEAHVLLAELAGWPAPRLPLLAAELHRAGLEADWATLLWEVAALPPAALVAAADALAAAGRGADARRLLQQGVARPAPEIADALHLLTGDGRDRQARALAGAYLAVRSPEDAAGVARSDPDRLVPLLLDAARGVSEERHWDLVHAFRVAGVLT
ncbi:hypothetical protein [Streptomyces fungicidicus]|uniref:Uncharacterized protein n=1 Tax=Streptomyces fungicidicus TaxID=68203 RepID=A0ACC7XSS4_9ACTN|nr:hypothetical protein [Streptomyces fungicidicus]NUV72623.1 hypothetical protein [Streptomyces fungicidicus]